MIPNVLYLISSHISYLAPLKRIWKTTRYLNSVTVMGGCAQRSTVELRSGQYVFEATHNSFDYTAIIELMQDCPVSSGHVFLLQDTMELSPDSDALIRSANIHACATAAWGGQCNLALFRYDYLLAHRDYILSLKNCTKAQAVQEEGKLWRMAPEDRRHTYANSSCEILGKGTPYGGAERLKEYYGGVGITKWKANYGQGGKWIEKP
jgi:hypothetical protein